MASSGQLKLGFVLLAHESVEAVSELVDTLISAGDMVSMHYDARSPMPDYLALHARYADNPQVLFARRVPCGWGDFSLVEGTLNALVEFKRSGVSLDYVYLLSGADLPLKSLRSLKTFLASHLRDRTEFIESVPLGPTKWVRGGLEAERFAYRHYFNERRHPLLFKRCWTLQRRFGLKRKPPQGIRISLGSQWWCLTWDTCQKILDVVSREPEIDRFFRTTWIPDESYFQTLVRKVAGDARVKGYSLTYYQFSDYGKPVVFYDEHYSFLIRQNFFFGRKAAHSAKKLREKLHRIGRSGEVPDFDYRRIGRYTADIYTYRNVGRRPSPECRSIGVSYGTGLADIPFIKKRLVMILNPVDFLSHTGAPFRGMRGDSWLAHGHLFDADRIGFSGGTHMFAGFGAQDQAARDAWPAQFLAAVLGAGPAVTGFFATPPRGIELANRLIRAENVLIRISIPASLEAMVTAEVINRFIRFDDQWTFNEDDVAGCIGTVMANIDALSAFAEIVPDFRTLAGARNRHGVVRTGILPVHAGRPSVDKVLRSAAECEKAGLSHMARLPLCRRVKKVIHGHGMGSRLIAAQIDIAGRPGMTPHMA